MNCAAGARVPRQPPRAPPAASAPRRHCAEETGSAASGALCASRGSGVERALAAHRPPAPEGRSSSWAAEPARARIGQLVVLSCSTLPVSGPTWPAAARWPPRAPAPV
eukprot:scaffold284378_cov31-Tisochrysis_lutea.AAC.4